VSFIGRVVVSSRRATRGDTISLSSSAGGAARYTLYKRRWYALCGMFYDYILSITSLLLSHAGSCSSSKQDYITVYSGVPYDKPIEYKVRRDQ
jgi:hypothetical protein